MEEKTIVRYIVELCARTFHPRLYYVEDMANRLLRERGEGRGRASDQKERTMHLDGWGDCLVYRVMMCVKWLGMGEMTVIGVVI